MVLDHTEGVSTATVLKAGGSGTRWFIEGDIKGFFDNINHDVLISILSERIHDERFLRLIRKFLKAGYLEQWNTKTPTSALHKAVSSVLSDECLFGQARQNSC